MTFIPFRLKILGSFLALLGAVLGVSLVIVSRSQTRQTESSVKAQLETTRTVFSSILDRREEQLAAALRLLGGDFAFKQAVSTRDPATIESAALNLRERIGADDLWVADDEGRLFADTSHLMKPGESVAGLPAAAQALAGAPGASIIPLHGRVYQLAAVPLNAPDLIGILVAGFALDDRAAAELKRMTRTDVSFGSESGLFASTEDPRGRRMLEEARDRLAGHEPSLIGPAGQRRLVLAASVAPRVTAYLERNWDEALEPLRELQRLLGVIGLAGFALAALAGYLIAEGVTASVGQLVQATRRLVQGDYAARVEIRQRDEIGQLGQAFNRMVEGLQEREKIRSVLRKAVSKEIADELLKRGQINLGGEEKSVTVLFSDIRGFTTISEGLAPAELVAQLNAYFTKMAKAVEASRGVIDKYIGDAIMALFGAPLETAEDAVHAQRAALAMVAALDELNAERSRRGLPPWRNGIGLNTGRAVAGTLGSEDRWSYTVIGDAVNLSSRLEGLTKHYGVRILVSQATRDAGAGNFIYRALDLVRVKGKNEPVEVFELLGEGVPRPAWLDPFEAGVRAYRGRSFPAAQKAFEDVLRARPDDGPARGYLERLKPLLGGPVPDAWDPAHTMLEK